MRANDPVHRIGARYVGFRSAGIFGDPAIDPQTGHVSLLTTTCSNGAYKAPVNAINTCAGCHTLTLQGKVCTMGDHVRDASHT